VKYVLEDENSNISVWWGHGERMRFVKKYNKLSINTDDSSGKLYEMTFQARTAASCPEQGPAFWHLV
jgi:hypothetical protein